MSTLLPRPPMLEASCLKCKSLPDVDEFTLTPLAQPSKTEHYWETVSL